MLRQDLAPKFDRSTHNKLLSGSSGQLILVADACKRSSLGADGSYWTFPATFSHAFLSRKLNVF